MWRDISGNESSRIPEHVLACILRGRGEYITEVSTSLCMYEVCFLNKSKPFDSHCLVWACTRSIRPENKKKKVVDRESFEMGIWQVLPYLYFLYSISLFRSPTLLSFPSFSPILLTIYLLYNWMGSICTSLLCLFSVMKSVNIEISKLKACMFHSI